MRKIPSLGAAFVALLVALTALPTSTAFADEGLLRTDYPSAEDPGFPFYARIDAIVDGAPPVYTDGEWAAIVFYRDPGCIPGDFNLMEFFDFNAFACPHTTSGFNLWEGAPLTIPPKVTKSFGTEVPVWFVPTSTIEVAIADGVLTIGELAGLDGLLIGTADRFSETLHPHSFPIGGGHPVPKLILNAKGQLDDGRQFALNISMLYPDLRTISIKLG